MSESKDIFQEARLKRIQPKRKNQKNAGPDRRAVKVFDILQKANRPVGAGGIVCMTDAAYPVGRINSFIPANLI